MVFAYCQGNPVNYSDPTGYAKTTDADGSEGGRSIRIKASDVSFPKFPQPKSSNSPKVSLPKFRNAFSRIINRVVVKSTITAWKILKIIFLSINGF